MQVFGWLSQDGNPPCRWDLRQFGWSLNPDVNGRRADYRHVLIADVRQITALQRAGMAEADHQAWRLIMLGVEEPGERAHLLSAGCAEALPEKTGARELEVRARRVNGLFSMLPRWRTIGPLTLDLFHRDCRQGPDWLGLHPREFGVIWRLADDPGTRITRQQLLQDVWRLDHDPQTNSVEVHVSRLRSKLAHVGCDHLIETTPRGGYRLRDNASFMLAKNDPQADALDLYLREIGWIDTNSHLPKR